MTTLVENLALRGNPFEHYTAETEPHITEYAVKPPYLNAITSRANSLSSFILFGDRGAGKSATRITLFNELWKGREEGATRPIAINYIDFTSIIGKYRAGALQDSDLIADISFFVIEQVLAWLASMTEDERQTYTHALTDQESELAVALLKTFYLPRPLLQRSSSESAALKLLNQAWTTRSRVWVDKRWDALSKLVAGVVEGLTKRHVSENASVASSVEELLRAATSTPSDPGGRVVLEKLVEFVRIFSFSGIVILVDKVDETNVTQSSALATTKLIYPILSHIQLLEVEGFSWMFFLWSQVKPFMEGSDFPVRLDKIAHTTIDWDVRFFREMLDTRIRYFSNSRLAFSDLFDDSIDTDQSTVELIETSMRSPRELIRLLDVIVTEHDIAHGNSGTMKLLDQQSLANGQDKYVKERINSVYSESTLGQIYRLRSVKFINKDVQRAFRIGAQSARNKIRAWEDAGIIKQTGTRAAEGDQGGKPSYEYSVIDTRVERVIKKRLINPDDADDLATDTDFEVEDLE